MSKFFTLTALVLLLGQFTYAQTDSTSLYSNKKTSVLGVGLGLTYGGLGGRFLHNPSNNLGIFLGLGYNFVGLGYNGGLIYYIAPEKQVQGYVSAMYGTNSVIKVVGVSELDGAYVGPSLGLGINLKSAKNPNTYWDLGIIIPVRSSEFSQDWDAVKNNSGIEVQQDPLPILINIGYNFSIN